MGKPFANNIRQNRVGQSFSATREYMFYSGCWATHAVRALDVDLNDHVDRCMRPPSFAQIRHCIRGWSERPEIQFTARIPPPPGPLSCSGGIWIGGFSGGSVVCRPPRADALIRVTVCLIRPCFAGFQRVVPFEIRETLDGFALGIWKAEINVLKLVVESDVAGVS